MKKIIFVFLCCVLLVGCSNKPVPAESVAPTTSKTIVTEEPPRYNNGAYD